MGGFARAHHPVDLHQRLEARLGPIDSQRIGDERAPVKIVDIERADRLDSRFDQRVHLHGVQLVVGAGQQLAGLLVDNIVGQDSAVQVVGRDVQKPDAGFLQLAHVTHGDAPVLFHHRLVADLDIETGGFALSRSATSFSRIPLRVSVNSLMSKKIFNMSSLV